MDVGRSLGDIAIQLLISFSSSEGIFMPISESTVISFLTRILTNFEMFRSGNSFTPVTSS